MSFVAFGSLDKEERDLVVQAYVGAYERWSMTHSTPDSPVQAVGYWWIQAGPTSYTQHDGKLLRAAMVEVLAYARRS